MNAATATRRKPTEPREARPLYELHATGLGGGALRLEIWQLPSPSTPRLTSPERTAALKGKALETVELRLLRRLKAAQIGVAGIRKGDTRRFVLDEDLALNLALLFRVLAPMRSIDRMRMVTNGIENLSREEAGYWLGMAVHRKYPRRVLAALRMLLTSS